MPIAFLHTSPMHVPTFTNILRELAPHELSAHRVDESLLADARKMGTSDPAIIRRVHEAMHLAAAQNTADVVVCTCSTIGGIAEETDTGNRFLAMRVDRAMADEAIRRGTSILISAALGSTLAPTRALIEDAARRQARAVSISIVAIPEAWRQFEKGELHSYSVAIASGITNALDGHDVIVLAQASMTPAEALLTHTGVPVLSSPRLGVQAAVRALALQGAITAHRDASQTPPLPQ